MTRRASRRVNPFRAFRCTLYINTNTGTRIIIKYIAVIYIIMYRYALYYEEWFVRCNYTMNRIRNIIRFAEGVLFIIRASRFRA